MAEEKPVGDINASMLSKFNVFKPSLVGSLLGSLLLAWFNFNPSMSM